MVTSDKRNPQEDSSSQASLQVHWDELEAEIKAEAALKRHPAQMNAKNENPREDQSRENSRKGSKVLFKLTRYERYRGKAKSDILASKTLKKARKQHEIEKGYDGDREDEGDGEVEVKMVRFSMTEDDEGDEDGSDNMGWVESPVYEDGREVGEL